MLSKKDINKMSGLLYLLSVMQNKSKRKASESLSTSIDTLNKYIAELEQELGLKIFSNDGHGSIISPQGQELVILAEELNDILQQLDDIALSSNKVGGQVKIGVEEGVSQTLFNNKIIDFITNYPDMHIMSSCCDNVNQMNLHTIDILLSYTIPSSNTMSVYHSSVLPCGLFASKSYIDKFGFPNTLQELVNEHHFCDNPNYIRQIQGWKEFRKLLRHISYSANSVYMVNNMVSAGGGIGLMPLHHKYDNLLNIGQILAETGINFSYNIHLLAHPKTLAYPKIAAVLNLLKQVMSEP